MDQTKKKTEKHRLIDVNCECTTHRYEISVLTIFTHNRTKNIFIKFSMYPISMCFNLTIAINYLFECFLMNKQRLMLHQQYPTKARSIREMVLMDL